jgi:integrase
MPLELRWKLDGKLRPFWYGRYEVNGKRYCPNLGVKIAGTPPASQSLKDEGDTAFERSRAAAQAKLDGIVEEARTQQGSARLVEKLYEIKTGETLRSAKLRHLAEEWAKIPRKRKPSDRYVEQSKVALQRFADFVAKENPKAEEVAHVTRALAQAFMDKEANRGVTARTRNDTLSLLRTAFKALLPGGVINPFLSVLMQEAESVFRKPFSPDELKAITEAARDDEFIRPLLVTGMCTAMRRGDCCLLQWRDVDLDRQFITVKTGKTRQTVSIPIFPLLEEELRARSKKLGPKREGFVFPEQAAMYRENPTGITWRVKKILAMALTGENPESRKQKTEIDLPEVGEEEVRKRGDNYIATLPEGERRERMATVFKLYLEGKSMNATVAASGVSKASVSEYLKAIETAAGCKIVRGRPTGNSFAAQLRANKGHLLEEREDGARRASVRDFHSLRVTWVTLALTAGVPLELVQKVTGHKTTDIVLKHYFQPGREAFRQALQKAMPALLTQGQRTEVESQKPGRIEDRKRSSGTSEHWEKVMEEMRRILRQSTAETWMRDRKGLLTLLRAGGEGQWGELANRDLQVG